MAVDKNKLIARGDEISPRGASGDQAIKVHERNLPEDPRDLRFC